MRILSSFTLICIAVATYFIHQWGNSEFATWLLGLSYGFSFTALWNKESRVIEDGIWRLK